MLKTATTVLACAVAVQAMDSEEREGRSKYRALRRKLGHSKSKSGSKSGSKDKKECREGWLGFDFGADTAQDAFTAVDED